MGLKQETASGKIARWWITICLFYFSITLVLAKRNDPISIDICVNKVSQENARGNCTAVQYFDKVAKKCRCTPGKGTVLAIDRRQQCSDQDINKVEVKNCSVPYTEEYYIVCQSTQTIYAKCPRQRHFNQTLRKCPFTKITHSQTEPRNFEVAQETYKQALQEYEAAREANLLAQQQLETVGRAHPPATRQVQYQAYQNAEKTYDELSKAHKKLNHTSILQNQAREYVQAWREYHFANTTQTLAIEDYDYANEKMRQARRKLETAQQAKPPVSEREVEEAVQSFRDAMRTVIQKIKEMLDAQEPLKQAEQKLQAAQELLKQTEQELQVAQQAQGQAGR